MEILELESWNIEAPLPPLEALRNVWVAPYHNVGRRTTFLIAQKFLSILWEILR